MASSLISTTERATTVLKAKRSQPRGVLSLHTMFEDTDSRRSWKRPLGVLSVIFVVYLSAVIAEVNIPALIAGESRVQMWSFIAEGFPPNLNPDFVLGPQPQSGERSLQDGLAWAVIETLAISIAGTALAVVLAVPLALVSTATITHRGPLYAGSSPVQRGIGRTIHRTGRMVSSFLRSVPELVWGFLFVTAVGLGPFAGVLALGIHNAGVLGKLYADFLEDTDPDTTESVASSGATTLQSVCHGMIPQVTATLVSYTLYRWECSIRSASVLGFVGAGGIGYYLVITIKRLQYQKLLTAIIAVFVLVVLSDNLAARLRSKFG